jgi:hypothetical protein
MNAEIRADQLALQRVMRGRYAKEWTKIFPQDSQAGYQRLFKTLETINILGYAQLLDGWYQENVTDEQKERMLRFYPPV